MKNIIVNVLWKQSDSDPSIILSLNRLAYTHGLNIYDNKHTIYTPGHTLFTGNITGIKVELFHEYYLEKAKAFANASKQLFKNKMINNVDVDIQTYPIEFIHNYR